MKYLIISLLCLYGAAAPAQDCDQKALSALPGKWLPPPGDEVLSGSPRPAAADAAGAKNVFQQIGKMFQQEYRPMGVDVYNYLTHSITPGSNTNGYIYTLSNFRFICINGKRTRNSEGVSSSVHINPEGSLTVKFSEMPICNESGEVSSEALNSCGFYSLSPKECKSGKLPDLSKGYHSVENGYDYYVWITHPGQLPYRYVSRKEFLKKQVAICEAKLKELHAFYSSKGWKEQFDAFPEQLLEGRKNSLAMYEDPLKAYREDLEKGEIWLNEMAVVSSGTVNDPVTKKYLYSRYLFTTLNDPAMIVPVMPNPSYYNRNLPKSAPRFIVINVGRTDGFIGENIRKVVDEQIEFFKGLLVDHN